MIKQRNPIFVIVASFLTFFLYALYWFYSTAGELIELTKSGSSAALWTIGLFVPIVNLWIIWKYCSAAEEISEGRLSKVMLFVLWIVFVPISMYMVQNELNQHA